MQIGNNTVKNKKQIYIHTYMDINMELFLFDTFFI